jgi:hypothetical protein
VGRTLHPIKFRYASLYERVIGHHSFKSDLTLRLFAKETIIFTTLCYIPLDIGSHQIPGFFSRKGKGQARPKYKLVVKSEARS